MDSEISLSKRAQRNLLRSQSRELYDLELLESHINNHLNDTGSETVCVFIPGSDEAQISFWHWERRLAGIWVSDDLQEFEIRLLSSERVGRHRLGFQQPSRDSQPLQVEGLEAILVPGLAFTSEGNRLGRGGGVYDRILSTVPESCQSIGVVSGPQHLVEHIPIEEHDQKVNCLATEKGVMTVDGA